MWGKLYTKDIMKYIENRVKGNISTMGGGLIPGMHGIENIMEFLPNVGNLHQQARAL